MPTTDAPAQGGRKIEQGWLTLVQATLALGMNRERLMRRIQNGLIRARQSSNGRWEVSRRSLEAYQQRRNKKDPH